MRFCRTVVGYSDFDFDGGGVLLTIADNTDNAKVK